MTINTFGLQPLKFWLQSLNCFYLQPADFLVNTINYLLQSLNFGLKPLSLELLT